MIKIIICLAVVALLSLTAFATPEIRLGRFPEVLPSSDVYGTTSRSRAEFYNDPLFASDVAVLGDYAYVAGGQAGLLILDISDPTRPLVTGSYDISGGAGSVAVAGQYAYVGFGESGLRIIDILDPTNPTEVGFIITPSTVSDVAVAGNYAYVADWEYGLRIIDILDPANLSEVGSYGIPEGASSVAVSGQYAYVGYGFGGSGLSIINILDPTKPTEAGFVVTPSAALDVAVAGNYAYVANLDDGLRIIDISDPVNPREIGFHKSTGVVLSVTILGTHAYICAREAGLRIIDISDPANPNESSFYDTPGLASNVALAGKYVYIADYERGLRIIDISDPANLGEVGFYETRGSPEELIREENAMLTIFTFAGAIATLLLHGLSWHTRLNHLSIAVRLGTIGAIGTILYSGFIVFSYFLGPSGGADAFEFMRYVFIAFWLLSLLAVLLIGLLQARSLPVPGWKGVLSAFYEIGLGFLAVTGLNYALQYLIRTPEGMSDRVYLARFTITLVIGLVALALIRPFARLYRFRDRSNS